MVDVAVVVVAVVVVAAVVAADAADAADAAVAVAVAAVVGTDCVSMFAFTIVQIGTNLRCTTITLFPANPTASTTAARGTTKLEHWPDLTLA